jgi:hypothetical protein
MKAPIEVIETSPVIKPSPITLFHQHLRQAEPVYAMLMELKEKVRSYLGNGTVIEEADMYRRDGRIQKETNTSSIKDREPTLPRGSCGQILPMMQEIGDEMQAATGALCQNNRSKDGLESLIVVWLLVAIQPVL